MTRVRVEVESVMEFKVADPNGNLGSAIWVRELRSGPSRGADGGPTVSDFSNGVVTLRWTPSASLLTGITVGARDTLGLFAEYSPSFAICNCTPTVYRACNYTTLQLIEGRFRNILLKYFIFC